MFRWLLRERCERVSVFVYCGMGMNVYVYVYVCVQMCKHVCERSSLWIIFGQQLFVSCKNMITIDSLVLQLPY